MRSQYSADAIVIERLVKTYGEKKALNDVDLTIPRGSVHAILGPNGAGKTTMVRILATLLRPTSGRATVAGFDVIRQADEVRYRIGLLGQHAAVDEELSGRQNLELFGRLYHLGGQGAAERATELLEKFELADTGKKAIKKYSGGMRRRLDLAASLIMTPDILFLDEPTTGLDPRGRTEVWNAVRSLAGGGTTILLTTQYLEEADQLADRISVMDHGRIVADGTADELKAKLSADRIDVVVQDAGQLDHVASLVARTTQSGEVNVDADRRLVSATVANRMAALSDVIHALQDSSIQAEDVALRRPTLDEVFLYLTGSRPQEGSDQEVSA